jgi:hypothetical protein
MLNTLTGIVKPAAGSIRSREPSVPACLRRALYSAALCKFRRGAKFGRA